MRCRDAPRLRREEERRALVAARSEHRQNSGYEAVEAEYQRAMRAYGDDTYFREFAKDCYLAGVSMIQPRRSLRRAFAIRENQKRLEWREEIIDHARQLDAIDRQGGFDSSDEFLPPGLGPPEGDTHYHRAWIAILEADRRRLAHIVRRRRLRASRWLGRAAARYALACLWAAVVVVVALELDDKTLQDSYAVSGPGAACVDETAGQDEGPVRGTSVGHPARAPDGAGNLVETFGPPPSCRSPDTSVHQRSTRVPADRTSRRNASR